MNPDASILQISARQHGVVTGDQLRESGFSYKQIHSRRSSGRLIKVLPGVFRVGGVPDTYESRLWSVALWIDDKGFFTGPTAAHLLSLDGIGRPECLSVARYSGVAAPSWIKVQRLDPNDRPSLRRVRGLLICCVERVLADCASSLSPRVVGSALDDALRRRLTTVERLQDFLESWGRGRHGARTLNELVRGRDERDQKVRSVLETKMLAILRRIPNHHFHADFELVVGDHRYFLDFYCAPARLGIECQGFKWHIGRFNSDARRNRHIQSLGIELLHFTWDDVSFRGREVEKEIRAAIARRMGNSSALLSFEARSAE